MLLPQNQIQSKLYTPSPTLYPFLGPTPYQPSPPLIIKTGPNHPLHLFPPKTTSTSATQNHPGITSTSTPPAQNLIPPPLHNTPNAFKPLKPSPRYLQWKIWLWRQVSYLNGQDQSDHIKGSQLVGNVTVGPTNPESGFKRGKKPEGRDIRLISVA